MPTILRIGPYRFFFVSTDYGEPPHVHVDRDDQSAKFWIDPLALAGNLGFSARELGGVQSLVSRHRLEILEAWRAYFGTSDR